MSFTIRGNFGGPNAFDPSIDKNDPVRQSAIRLSLGLKVSAPNRDHPTPTSSDKSPAQTAATTEKSGSDYSITASQSIVTANTEAATTEVFDVASAAAMPELSSPRAAQPTEFPQTRSPHNRSAYDLDSFVP